MITDKEYDWLLRIKKVVDKYWDELMPFEKGFIEDILARFEIHGRNTIISPKQWSVISNISEKILP